MATQYLTRDEAFQVFADALVEFQTHRSRGLDFAQAAAAMRISAGAAAGYESTISRLMADLKTEAAPDPARSEAAPEKAQSTPTEGATAP